MTMSERVYWFECNWHEDEMNWIGWFVVFFGHGFKIGRHQKTIQFSNIPTKILPGSHVCVECLFVFFPQSHTYHTHLVVIFFGLPGNQWILSIRSTSRRGWWGVWNPLMGVDGWLGWWCGKTPWRYGCFLKWWYPQNTPKCSFLVEKSMVVGYHHFRKPPYDDRCLFLVCVRKTQGPVHLDHFVCIIADEQVSDRAVLFGFVAIIPLYTIQFASHSS